MDSKVNYALVGFFIIVVGALSILLFLWLTSFKHRQVYDTYVMYSHEEVSGLSLQSPVRYSGVRVGYIASIALNNKDPQQVILTLKIKRGTPITTSTIATIMTEGLTGIQYIGLTALASSSPLLVAKTGEPYPVIPSEPSLFFKLSTALQDMTVSIRSLSDDVSKVFNEKNRRALQDSLNNFAIISQTIVDNKNNINESLSSLKKLLSQSAEASQQFPEIVKQIKNSLEAVKQASDQVHSVAENAQRTLQQTKILLQTTTQQVLPSVTQLLDQLNTTAGNFQQLSNQLIQNPAILVRGQLPPSPGPGE